MTGNKHRVAFAMAGRKDGVDITPATISFSDFNRFNQEVATFVPVDAQGTI